MKNRISLAFLFLLITMCLNAQDANRFFPKEDLMSMGIYYYPRALE
jgi:beta-galactosidase